MPLTKQEADRVVEVIRGCMVGVDPSSPLAVGAGQTGKTVTMQAKANGADLTVEGKSDRSGAAIMALGSLNEDALEALYARMKNRLIDDLRTDPTLLRLLMNQNEIVVEIEPQEIRLDGATTRGRVARLLAQGWFTTKRTIGGLRAEMKRTGPDPGGGGALYDIAKDLVRQGFLINEGDGFIAAPDIKVTEKTVTTKTP